MSENKYTKQVGYRLRHYRKKRQSGICVSCTKPAEGESANCTECKEKRNRCQRERQSRYTAEGKCRDCGLDAELTTRSLRNRDRGAYCSRCWLKRLALFHLGSGKFWTVLIKKLDECNWCCSYTGEKLVLGVNLSFDHMDPVARFPERKHDADNVVPCSWQVNLMKRDLTRSEFLALVSKIHNHGDGE